MEHQTNTQIKKACDYAAATDFIENMPQSYQTIIGENGIKRFTSNSCIKTKISNWNWTNVYVVNSRV